MKPLSPAEIDRIVTLTATNAGREALAQLVDERGIVADDLWRWLIKQGAAR